MTTPTSSRRTGQWSVVPWATGAMTAQRSSNWLDRLYVRLHLYVNFFLPVVKLQEKVRFGARSSGSMTTHRRPMHACRPALRLRRGQGELREAYGYLDLIELRRSIDDLQVQLLRTLSRTD